MSAASVVCPTCDAQPLLPCVEDGRVLAVFHSDRYTAAKTEEENVVLSLWRSMSGAAVAELEQRAKAEAATRGEPGMAPPLVVDEDAAARRRS